MLWYNELCAPWPDTSVCFCLSALFSRYICCWIYSRYSNAHLFHRCVSQHVKVQRLVLNILFVDRLERFLSDSKVCLHSFGDFTYEAFMRTQSLRNSLSWTSCLNWTERHNVPGNARGVMESNYSGFHTAALVSKHDSDCNAELIWIMLSENMATGQPFFWMRRDRLEVISEFSSRARPPGSKTQDRVTGQLCECVSCCFCVLWKFVLTTCTAPRWNA